MLPRVYARPARAVQGPGAGRPPARRPAQRPGLRAACACRETRGVRHRPRHHRAVAPRRHAPRAGWCASTSSSPAGSDARRSGRRRAARLGPRGRRRAGVARHAGRAAADRAHQHGPREAPARRPVGDSAADGAGGAGHRGPPLLRPPGRRHHPHDRRRRHQPARRSALPGRRQHDHAAAGEELLPHAREVAQAQARRAVHGDHPRAQGVEGRDPRALPQRRLSRPARVVCRPRRRRGRAAVLRQRRHEPLAGRGGHHRRRDSVAVLLVAVCRARRGAASGATSCWARWPRRSSSRPTPPRAPAAEPIEVVQRALDAQAPYFVDVVGQALGEQFPGLSQGANRVEVFTTLDPHLQRLAQDALRDGLVAVDALLAKKQAHADGRRRRSSRSIRAPAKSWRWWAAARTTSRSSTARSPPGASPDRCSSRSCIWRRSRWPPPRTAPTSRRPSLVTDEPTIFLAGGGSAPPDTLAAGAVPPTTGRRQRVGGRLDAEQLRAGIRRRHHAATGAGALAQHRHHQGRAAGGLQQGRRALGSAWAWAPMPTAIRRSRSASSRPRHSKSRRPTRSFPTAASLRPLRVLSRVVADGASTVVHDPPTRTIARADTTFLVTNMMRSVINEGTGAAARANGFALDAAGKSGTTNDLRDGWFVGFTPELLTVVWVGFDDNQPLGLSGTQAALPDLDDLHEPRAGRTPRPALCGAHRHRLRRDRSRHRAAGRSAVPAPVPRGLPQRQRTDDQPATCIGRSYDHETRRHKDARTVVASAKKPLCASPCLCVS